MASTTTSLLQLSSLGPQDKYISLDPQVSLINYNYKRCNPIARNPTTVLFNEPAFFGKTLTVSLPRVGDMINDTTLYIKLPQLNVATGSTYTGWCQSVGFAIIEYVEILIGEVVIDRHTDLSMEVLDYLTCPSDKKKERNRDVGRYDTELVLPLGAITDREFYIPFQFWFNKKVSASLPLILLDKQDVKFRLKFRDFQELVLYDGSTPPALQEMLDSHLIVDYLILNDKDKALLTSKSEMTYLIDQVQCNVFKEINASRLNAKVLLDYRQPVKEIVFVVREQDSLVNNDYYLFGQRNAATQGEALIKTAQVLFDGKPRIKQQNEKYFRTVTPQKFHTFSGDRNIYVVSFAEAPELNQPSGTVNFSRFDAIYLDLVMIDSLPACEIFPFAISYNVLTIKKGSASLEFIG